MKDGIIDFQRRKPVPKLWQYVAQVEIKLLSGLPPKINAAGADSLDATDFAPIEGVRNIASEHGCDFGCGRFKFSTVWCFYYFETN